MSYWHGFCYGNCKTEYITMENKLKYRAADIIELLDVFAKINDSDDRFNAVLENAELISKFPAEDLQKFVDALKTLESNNTEVTKENYYAIIGYILMRMCL